MRHLRSLTTLALASGVLGVGAGDAASAPETTALIRPGIGIGKVRLGMTQAQVRRALGRHTVVNLRERRFGLTYLELAYDYSAYTVGFFGAPGKLRVVSVATSLRRERTRNGLGPGTSLRALRRALRGERCRRRPIVTSIGYHTECSVFTRSGARTTFVAAPECDAQKLTCGAPIVFEVAVSRGARYASAAADDVSV
jgi:hypothetical protein